MRVSHSPHVRNQRLNIPLRPRRRKTREDSPTRGIGMLRLPRRADYHFPVAGDARALLEQMRLRLERGAHAALGVPEAASLPVARAAFLQLTKTYHPAKFAREAPDVVRQANEIFLALRAAYDQVTQQGRRASQVMPASAAIGRSTGSVAARAGGGSPPPPIGQPGSQPLATQPSAPSATSSSSSLPAAAAAPPVVSLKPAVATPAGSSAQRQPAKPSPSPAAKPGSGTVSGVGAPPRLDRPQQVGARPGAAPATPGAPAPSAAPAGAVPAPARAPAPAAVVKGTTQLPKLSDGVAPGSEEADLEIAMHYIKRKQWSDARKQLHALAARVPADKRYRALLSYARGREQQDDGRHDEARAEFNRALQLDPDLYMAKNALQQLGSVASDEPEKPSGGGLFSRLFRK
jgi:tetratricopeptide (TPR) repeat protein